MSPRSTESTEESNFMITGTVKSVFRVSSLICCVYGCDWAFCLVVECFLLKWEQTPETWCSMGKKQVLCGLCQQKGQCK